MLSVYTVFRSFQVRLVNLLRYVREVDCRVLTLLQLLDHLGFLLIVIEFDLVTVDPVPPEDFGAGGLKGLDVVDLVAGVVQDHRGNHLFLAVIEPIPIGPNELEIDKLHVLQVTDTLFTMKLKTHYALGTNICVSATPENVVHKLPCCYVC